MPRAGATSFAQRRAARLFEIDIEDVRECPRDAAWLAWGRRVDLPYLNRNDAHHAWAVAVLKQARPPS